MCQHPRVRGGTELLPVRVFHVPLHLQHHAPHLQPHLHQAQGGGGRARRRRGLGERRQHGRGLPALREQASILHADSDKVRALTQKPITSQFYLSNSENRRSSPGISCGVPLDGRRRSRKSCTGGKEEERAELARRGTDERIGMAIIRRRSKSNLGL